MAKKKEKKKHSKTKTAKKKINSHKKAVHKVHKPAKMPFGIKILIIYSIILGLSYLVFGFSRPTSIIFGRVIEGTVAKIINFFFLAVLATMIYGLIARKHFVFKLALAWLGFEVFNCIISLVLISDIFAGLFNFMRIFFVFIIVLDSIIIAYLISKKDYFIDFRHHIAGFEDKIFALSLFVLFIFALVFVSSYTVNLYLDAIDISRDVVGKLDGKSLGEALLMCSQQQGNYKDVCYMTVGTAYHNNQDFVCDKIDSSFYKLTCYQSII